MRTIVASALMLTTAGPAFQAGRIVPDKRLAKVDKDAF